MLHGGQISRRGGCFSGDGRLFVAPCGNDVRVYSAASGEQAGQLEGHTAEVTAVVPNPGMDTQVYSASLDGTLRLWDLSTGECTRVLAVREAIRYMAIHGPHQQAYLAIDWRDGQSGRVIAYSLAAGRAASSAVKTRGPGPVTMNPNGRLVATIDRHSLLVWRVGPEMAKPLNLHHTKPYTCLAIGPDDTAIAAGDASGRILIWRDVEPRVPHAARSSASEAADASGAAAAPPPVTTLHWHAGPVSSLSFSPDGTYLRSGGGEGVLVTWQLAGDGRDFLPRLGGALLALAHCPAAPNRLLICQADNTLRVVNLGSRTVEASTLGLRPPPATHLARPAAVQCAPATVLHPRAAGLLALPAHNGVLQLFDTAAHRHVQLLQAAPRNDVTPTRSSSSATETLAPRVTHAAFTPSGACLATVCVRPGAAGPAGAFGGGSAIETSLRFWDAGGTHGAAYTLNTLADDPHRGHVITCVAMHPSEDLLVTAGSPAQGSDAHGWPRAADGAPDTSGAAQPPEFRLWERVRLSRRPGAGAQGPDPSCWRCKAVGSYLGQAFHAAAFSRDGSLLALGGGAKVSLWDPATGGLAGLLPVPPELDPPAPPPGAAATPPAAAPIVHLCFIVGAPLLVGSNGWGVAVWDLLALRVAWAAPVRCCSLVADPARPRFAVCVPLQRARAASRKGGRGPGSEVGAAGLPSPTPAPTAAQPEPQQPWVQSSAGGLDSAACEACCVLAFDAGSPAPRATSHVPSTPAAQLLFRPQPPGDSVPTPQHDGALLSSLLVLTEDRRYIALGPEARSPSSSKAPTAAPANKVATPQGGVSSFEAAFGQLSAKTAGAQGEGVEDAGMLATQELRWRTMFDAPSHVLPPTAALASAYLRLAMQGG